MNKRKMKKHQRENELKKEVEFYKLEGKLYLGIAREFGKTIDRLDVELLGSREASKDFIDNLRRQLNRLELDCEKKDEEIERLRLKVIDELHRSIMFEMRVKDLETELAEAKKSIVDKFLDWWRDTYDQTR